MVETGLKATLNSKVSPEDMPPKLPPELLVFSRRLVSKRSLCSEPRILVPAKPEPNSKPLVAGMDIIAWAMRAWIYG